MINGFRFFLPCSGWVDVGLTPGSDGYGKPDVKVLVVINYEDFWLASTEIDIADFFLTLREIDCFANVNGQYYYHKETNFEGKVHVDEAETSLNIEYTSAEGDRSFIYNFMKHDLKVLLEMEKAIATKIVIVKVTEQDIVNQIEKCCEDCKGNANEIYRLAEYWYANDTTREMAFNHFNYFYALVNEHKSSQNKCE